MYQQGYRLQIIAVRRLDLIAFTINLQKQPTVL